MLATIIWVLYLVTCCPVARQYVAQFSTYADCLSVINQSAAASGHYECLSLYV